MKRKIKFQYYTINKIMNYSRNQSPSRVFDALEQGYNNQAHQYHEEEKRKKQLYFKIANMDQAAKSEIKNMEKELQQKQRERIKYFLQAQNQRYAEAQRKKKAYVDEVRRQNQNISNEIMHKSLARQNFEPYNDYTDFYIYQMEKQKREKQQFMKNAEEYQIIRKQKEKNQKQLQKFIDEQKKYEQYQNYAKRQAELKRIRDRHQPISALHQQYSDLIQRKYQQEKSLQDYIVNQGKNDQQAKMMEMRLNFEARKRQNIQNHIQQLKNQIDNDTYREAEKRKMEIDNDRELIHRRNQYFSEMDRLNKLRKSHDDKQMLQTLKNQVKPRKLIPEPQKIEKVGLGSPVNIGKVMGDDRKRQLDWIQKSLLKQIHY